LTNSEPIAAVLFDLDDTLFPQAAWLAGAWAAVAKEATRWGVDGEALGEALNVVAAEGTGRGRIIDRALEVLGATAPVDRLVAAFRAHHPAQLEPYPGVRNALGRLRALTRLAIVSDGDVAIQEAKLDGLGLGASFDVVVLSDRLGREHRKPDPAPFRLAMDRLGVVPEQSIFVGDRPAKDVAGAHAAGMRAIRVRTGEYAGEPDDPRPWLTVATAVDAADAIIAAHAGEAMGGR
jgi:putative hydrolase of the HAD superfamily